MTSTKFYGYIDCPLKCNALLHCALHSTLRGLDPLWIEESTLDVCMHSAINIHRKQRQIKENLTMNI
jgi:hypothetical protein